jgi:BlaI family transcriptional regulator, penicillinase repressor
MADRGPTADVPDAELAVLEVLWERGESTRRQIADVLYPRGGPAHYTTVQKLLERLEEKGYVPADRSRPVRVFRASVTREQLIRRRLRDVADKLCGGSLTPLLMNLVRAKPLSAAELGQLQALIRELGRGRKGPGGGR